MSVEAEGVDLQSLKYAAPARKVRLKREGKGAELAKRVLRSLIAGIGENEELGASEYYIVVHAGRMGTSGRLPFGRLRMHFSPSTSIWRWRDSSWVGPNRAVTDCKAGMGVICMYMYELY